MTPTHAFVGLERISGVMAYDVTNPAAPTFAGYVNTRNFSAPADSAEAGDLGPEGLLFIAAGDSPNGSPLLVVSNEVSGTVAVYQVGAAPAAMPGRLGARRASGPSGPVRRRNDRANCGRAAG